ncbi:MAG: hypothetical protein ACK4YP_28230, partial [Myxococcota bacterium]
MSPIEARIQALSREARLRRGAELAGSVVLSFVFAEYASWFESDVMRASAATVVACVLAVTVALIMLTRTGTIAASPSDGAAYVAAWQAALRRQARVYAWAPLWLVLPVLLAVCAFVLALDGVVYASRSPSPMLPADLGIVVALGLAAAVLNLEWSR